MPPLDETTKRVLASTPVIPVATASADGLPNVVPMTFVKALDDSTLLIADNYMDKAARNLKENPRVAVAVWDMETREAFQIKGIAEVFTEGPLFEEAAEWVRSIRPQHKTKSAVAVRVEHVYVCGPGPDRGRDVALP